MQLYTNKLFDYLSILCNCCPVHYTHTKHSCPCSFFSTTYVLRISCLCVKNLNYCIIAVHVFNSHFKIITGIKILFLFFLTTILFKPLWTAYSSCTGGWNIFSSEHTKCKSWEQFPNCVCVWHEWHSAITMTSVLLQISVVGDLSS